MQILYLTHRLPYAPNRGDRIRSHHTLRLLAAAEHRVHVFSLVHDSAEEAEVPQLAELAASVTVARVRSRLSAAPKALRALGTGTPLTHVLLDGGSAVSKLEALVERHPPDVVLAYCSGMAKFAMQAPLSGFPFVLDFVDIDSEKWRELGSKLSPMSLLYRREARCLGVFEEAAADAARMTTVVTDRERDLLLRRAPGARITVVPNGVDLQSFKRPQGTVPAHEPTAIFAAVFSYGPNAEAAGWLVRDIWPLVRRAVPDARLILAGADPPPWLRRLGDLDASIEVTGSVPEMPPYLWRSRVAVAPIRVSRGVQNKVLEAVAAGLPAVVSTAVAGGLPAEIRPACREADAAAPFADAVAALLVLDDEGTQQMIDRADTRALSWPERLRPLLNLLENARRR